METELFNNFLEKEKRKENLIFTEGVKTIFSNFDKKTNKWYIQYIRGL